MTDLSLLTKYSLFNISLWKNFMKKVIWLNLPGLKQKMVSSVIWLNCTKLGKSNFGHFLRSCESSNAPTLYLNILFLYFDQNGAHITISLALGANSVQLTKVSQITGKS